MTGKPFLNPYVAVFIGVVAVSFSSIFTKLATAPPMVIAFYRLLFTVLMLLPLSLSRSGISEFKSLNRIDLTKAFISGWFLALHFTVWIASLNYTSVASSTVLVTMQPLFVVSLGFIFLKEKISPGSAIGAFIALIGSCLIGASDLRLGGVAFWGDLLAFSGAFFIAIYVLIGRDLRKSLSLFPYVFLVYGTASLFLLIINLCIYKSLYTYLPGNWQYFLALAIIPTIFGDTVFNWALRYVKAAVVSVSILGEAVGATILGYFILGEVPHILQVIGGLVIISGLCIFIFSTKADTV
ncbi:MAG: hypothetical protein PWP31_1795 [Clostridia bacterium]|nr:hypothetical protein [Clostridia bacterium]